MNFKLLSIVIPTKNRAKYLESLVKLILSFEREDVEIVIEDNSDNNFETVQFLSDIDRKCIVYNYEPSSISVVENSDRAVKHSSGKYICFVGDDDLLSPKIVEFVELMDKYKCDSAIFKGASYSWPGVEFAAHDFPNLVIKKIKPSIYQVDPIKQLEVSLKHGAVSLENMPKLYHGVVRRECLEKIYEATNSYFPGPSPDMANAVALSMVVNKHVVCTLPLISAGASPKSTAGLGSKHKHVGELKEQSFLPKDTEETWNQNIPKIWTGPTIYAQSALIAIKRMNREHYANMFNYNYHYAWFSVFCSVYSELLKAFLLESPEFSFFKFQKSKISVFCVRVKAYLSNIKKLKLRIGVFLFDNVADTIQAEACIDSTISNVDMIGLFEHMEKNKHE